MSRAIVLEAIPAPVAARITAEVAIPTIGIGAGQMSRVDAAFLSVYKARLTGHDTKGSVMGSDAYFPFRDGVEQAAEAGVSAIVQPGGSIRDEEVIKAADEYNIAMVFTGKRQFRH